MGPCTSARPRYPPPRQAPSLRTRPEPRFRPSISSCLIPLRAESPPPQLFETDVTLTAPNFLDPSDGGSDKNELAMFVPCRGIFATSSGSHRDARLHKASARHGVSAASVFN